MNAAIILAAGIPGNLEQFQPLIKVSGTTVVRQQINTFRQTGIEDILIITGFRAAMLERHLSGEPGVRCCRNEDYAKTRMLDSIKLGVKALDDQCDAVLIIPADVPCVRAKAMCALLESESSIAVPSHNLSAGHPIMLRRELFNDLLNYNGKNGLNGFLTAHLNQIGYIPVDDQGILLELNSAEDIETLQKYERRHRQLMPMELSVEIKFCYGDFTVGQDLITLLSTVDDTGSLNKACAQLGFAYSRAWKMLGQAEKVLGYPMIERRVGGNDGGGSRLTESARELVEQYRSISQKTKRSANRILTKEFLQHK